MLEEQFVELPTPTGQMRVRRDAVLAIKNGPNRRRECTVNVTGEWWPIALSADKVFELVMSPPEGAGQDTILGVVPELPPQPSVLSDMSRLRPPR